MYSALQKNQINTINSTKIEKVDSMIDFTKEETKRENKKNISPAKVYDRIEQRKLENIESEKDQKCFQSPYVLKSFKIEQK